jgi:hypothetical protein
MKKNTLIIFLVVVTTASLAFGTIQYLRAQEMIRLFEVQKSITEQLKRDAETLQMLADEQRRIAERNAFEADMQRQVAVQLQQKMIASKP